MILFDDLHGHAVLQQSLCQIVGRAACAEEHHVFDLTLHQPQCPQQLLQLGRLGREHDAVARLRHEAAVRDHCRFPPAHGAEQEISLKALAQLHQRLAAELGFLPQRQLHHQKAAIGEGLHLRRRRKLQNLVKLQRRKPIRIDDERNIELLPQEFEIPVVILRIADARNGIGDAHAFCKVARQHIQLVRAGRRDEQLGPVYACLLQNVAVRAAAADAHAVKGVCDLSDHVRRRIHCDDLMPLLQQAGEDARADLAAADNDNVHRPPSIIQKAIMPKSEQTVLIAAAAA